MSIEGPSRHSHCGSATGKGQPVLALRADAAVAGDDVISREHNELALLAELSNTNTRIAHYIARVLDLDQGRTEYTTTLTNVEQHLAEDLLAVGLSLLDHSRRAHRTTHLRRPPALGEADTGVPPVQDEA